MGNPKWKAWWGLLVAPLVLFAGAWVMFGAGFEVGRSDLATFPAICAWSDPPPGVATCPVRP